MLGFVVGTLCLVGLVKVLGHGRWGHGRWGHGGWERGGPRGPWGWGGGPRRMMRGLFERLDTSPGQEKVLVEVAHEIREAGAPLREEMRASRRAIADALRAKVVDEEALGALFARHDDVLREARKRAVGALARVHDTLDDRQREAFAALLERGFGWHHRRGPAGPYRGAPSDPLST